MKNERKKQSLDVGPTTPLTSLPGSLDPILFAQARLDEIKILTKELSSSSSGNRRVFQTVPRHMRRRAASYNMKRLPRRLINRCILENSKNPSSSHSGIGKKPSCCRRKSRRTFSFQERSSTPNRMWLNTHLFHCKRAKMIIKWNHSIPFKVNEKCLRACVRASTNTSPPLNQHSSERPVIKFPSIQIPSLHTFITDKSYFKLISLKKSDFPSSISFTVPSSNIHIPSIGIIDFIIPSNTCDDDNIIFIVHPTIVPFLPQQKELQQNFSIFSLRGNGSLKTLSVQYPILSSLSVPSLSKEARRSSSSSNWTKIIIIDSNTKLIVNSTTSHPTKDKKLLFNYALLIDGNPSFGIKGEDVLKCWKTLVRQRGVRFGALLECNWVEEEIFHLLSEANPLLPLPSLSSDPIFSKEVNPFLFLEWAKEEDHKRIEKMNLRPPSKRNNVLKFEEFTSSSYRMMRIEISNGSRMKSGDPIKNDADTDDVSSICGIVLKGEYYWSIGRCAGIALIIADSCSSCSLSINGKKCLLKGLFI